MHRQKEVVPRMQIGGRDVRRIYMKAVKANTMKFRE
jgi:hypothetical protein